MKKSGKKGFARNSIVFTIDVKGELKEFWISDESYSVKRQIKKIMEANNKTLIDVSATIKRVSTATDETNYEIV